MAKRFVHLVVPAGTPPPLYAFTPSDAAYATARAILGVDVITVEVLDELPERPRTKTLRSAPDKIVVDVDEID